MLRRFIMAGLITSLFAAAAGCTQTAQQEPLENVRPPAVAGSFYPDDSKELKSQVDSFLAKVSKEKLSGQVFGLMVPHAGYVFSGQVAAYAFKQIIGEDIETVVLIGMSHRAYFEGISVCDQGYFETPLGLVKIDTNLAKAIIASHSKIKSLPQVQAQEHSLEVQLPFLQRALDKFKIVPILMSNPGDAVILADSLFKATSGKRVLFVASSDMTHYPTYEVANQIDPVTLSMIEGLDVQRLVDWLNQSHPGCDTLLCGSGAVVTLMLIAKKIEGSQAKVIKYANSGDVSFGDKSRVVGYGAVAFVQPGTCTLPALPSIEEEEKGMLLSQKNKKKLLEIARKTMDGYIRGQGTIDIETDDPELKRQCGVFVTLHKQGNLRGCIGYIKPIAPLAQAVSRMAIAASTEDPRFPPVSPDELKDIDIEITVLSELTKISDTNRIEVGRDGLFIVKGFHSGLLLPQVPVEQGWNREQFLTHTCYKAGLPATAWKEKDTEIYTFTGIIFQEEK